MRVGRSGVTAWDSRSRRVSEVMSTGIRGTDHPSRAFVRNWLRQNPGLTMLDIPCGPGIEYEGIRSEGLDVTYIGMDLTQSMLDLFRRRYPEADVRAGNILDIPLPDRSVDVVLCRHVLEHLEDYHPAVVEAVRVARKRVFLVLFLTPTHRVVRRTGKGLWINRLEWRELEGFIRVMRFQYGATQLPYDVPAHQLPSNIEENVVIEIRVDQPVDSWEGVVADPHYVPACRASPGSG